MGYPRLIDSRNSNGGRGDHVLIVGGGIIGAMSAWYLTGAGFRVTIAEKGVFGYGCSHGNCGYICPSHVLPLSQPGAIAKTMRAMMRRDSPFAIRPRLSRDFVSWFWNFYRLSNKRDMMTTASARHALLQSSMALYREFVQAEHVSCEWQDRGLLFVFDNARDFDAYAETDELLRTHFNVAATPYRGAKLQELEPALKDGPAGGWHYEEDCHIRPDRLMSELRRLLESREVTILESHEVTGFVRQGDRAIAAKVRTASANTANVNNVTRSAGQQDVEADHFVIATGARAVQLAADVGARVPIQPGKGYSITMQRPERMPAHPIIIEDSHVAITPMESGYRIGSTMEMVGYDTSINQKRLNLLTSGARKYLHDPVGDPIEETWFGWRPMTFDGKPVIDRAPALGNVMIAAGHGMLGLSMGAGTGKLVAEMLAGEQPHLDPTPYSALRFL